MANATRTSAVTHRNRSGSHWCTVTAASTVGGIIFDDADSPATQASRVFVSMSSTCDGGVIAGETNRIGVWVVEGLENGTYNVRPDGGRSTTTISVNNDPHRQKNQSISGTR